MRFKALFLGMFMAVVPMTVWGGACTVETPPITVTDGAVDAALTGTLNIYVTCPAGQAWTLYENAGANFAYWQFKNAGGPGDLAICRTSAPAGGACADYPLQTGPAIATGTGTGYPQAAQLGVSATRNGGWPGVQYAVNKWILPVWSGATLNTAANTLLKLTSEGVNYYPTAITASMSVTQECIISSTTNMSVNYSGFATTTGSFGVNYACGFGASIPPISMTIGPGNSANGEVRRAARAGGYLGYRLFWDSSMTQEIGAATNNSAILPASPSYGLKTIYGAVLKNDPGNHAPAGSGAYSDVVSIAITY